MIFFNKELFARLVYFSMKKMNDSPNLKWTLNTIFSYLYKLYDKYHILKFFPGYDLHGLNKKKLL